MLRKRVHALSYNIHSAIGRDRRCDPQRILDVIHATDAVVVGLQEVDARLRRKQRFDQFDFFREKSGMECIAGPNVVEHRGHYGNALLTTLPIESVRLIKLPTRGSEPRGAILAVLRHERLRLQVLNTHLGLRRAERREHARALLAEISGHDGPTLLVGDFIVWHPRSYVLGVLGAKAIKMALVIDPESNQVPSTKGIL
jgi:endonuclease/exonuclease/phosphatase family metal-dependent hydrolase